MRTKLKDRQPLITTAAPPIGGPLAVETFPDLRQHQANKRKKNREDFQYLHKFQLQNMPGFAL